MSPAADVRDARKQTIRMVAGSFAAGVGLMLFVGLIAPVAAQGGLSIRDAMAATVEQHAPAIVPLDVNAVEAQLARADAQMAATRASTDSAMSRLDRLAGR